ncbi:hypothetical protein D3C75_468240 [compost metagenome]
MVTCAISNADAYTQIVVAFLHPILFNIKLIAKMVTHHFYFSRRGMAINFQCHRIARFRIAINLARHRNTFRFERINRVISCQRIDGNRRISMRVQRNNLVISRYQSISSIIGYLHIDGDVVVTFMQPGFIHPNVITKMVANRDNFGPDFMVVNVQRHDVTITSVPINHSCNMNLRGCLAVNHISYRHWVDINRRINCGIELNVMSIGGGCRVASLVFPIDGDSDRVIAFN